MLCLIAAIRYTFRRAERLKSRKAIQILFREGKAFTILPYKVFYKAFESTENQFPVQIGFAVSSRSFSKAVDRNRIKRLGREAWRQQKQDLYNFLEKNNLSIHLFLVYAGKEIPVYQSVFDKLTLILTRLEKELTR